MIVKNPWNDDFFPFSKNYPQGNEKYAKGLVAVFILFHIQVLKKTGNICLLPTFIECRVSGSPFIHKFELELYHISEKLKMIKYLH